MNPSPETSRVLGVSIIEDDDELRANFVTLISRAPGFRVVSQHRTGEQAVEGIPPAAPDVVLMDINLPGMSGIDCVGHIRAQAPRILILMLTVYEDSDQIFQSFRAGANGYLLKRTPGSKLLESIREVCAGGSPMSSHIARKVVQFFNRLPAPSTELGTLSDREREVLEHLSRGCFYKEIADSLKISMDTVRKHLQNIYQKLHVHSRTEAVVKFLQR